jgi:hypothetical protein
VLNGKPDPLKRPDEVRPEISVPISQVLINAMALNANYRPSSAAAMRALLNDAKNNIARTIAEQPTVAAIPAGAVFDQKTQLIDGEQTAASAMLFNSTERAGAPSGGFDVHIPPTEVTKVSSFAHIPEKRRSRAWVPLTAVAALIVLVVCASAGLYIYRPGMFTQQAAPVEQTTSDDKPASDAGMGGAGEEPVQNAEVRSQNALKSSESKEQPKTNEAPKETKTRGDQDPNKDPDDIDVPGLEDMNGDGKPDADQRELQRAINKMVRNKMKQANIKDPKVRQQVEEQLRRDNLNDGVDGPAQPNQPVPPGRRRKWIIQRRRPDN